MAFRKQNARDTLLFMHRVRAGLWLLLALFIAFPAYADSPYSSTLDSELVTLRKQTAAQVQTLDRDLSALKAQEQQLGQQIKQLQSDNQQLEKTRSMFNRNGKRIQENQGKITTLTTESQQITSQITAKAADLRKKKNAAAGLNAEYQQRAEHYNTIKQVNLEKLEIYDVEILTGVKTSFQAVLDNQAAQIKGVSDRLATYTNPVGKETLAAQAVLKTLNEERARISYGLSKVDSEITRRQNDLALERQELEATGEQKRLALELRAKRAHALRNKKDEPLGLDQFFAKSEALEKQSKLEERDREQKKLTLYIGGSVVLFLVILVLLKRTLSH